MTLDNALNIFFGPALVIILVIAESTRKYSKDRTRKYIYCILLAISLVLLLCDFFISLTDINNYGIISLIINYLPFLLVIFIIVLFQRLFKRFTKHLIFFLFFLFLILLIDITIGSIKIIWPFLASLLLYIYFFIIRTETKIDNLTGLDNRYSFFEFTSRISRNNSGESRKIIMIDIDNFKSINDIFGHLEGDNALCDIASVIKNCIKKTDFACRYGGDEFVIVIKSEDDADILINNIKDELSKLNEKEKKPYNIEISYGYSIYNADGSKTIEEFLNYIDELMYTHKKERRRAGDLNNGN